MADAARSSPPARDQVGAGGRYLGYAAGTISATTRFVTDLPYKVTKTENGVIPLKDGTEIAITVWQPDGPGTMRLPAILDVIAYGKGTMTYLGDERIYGYLAGHGYVCVRADIRGNGESTGSMQTFMDAPEWTDTAEMIGWIARQPWCDGNVGMLGYSWGAISAYYTAIHEKPRELKAIAIGGFVTNRFHRGGVVTRHLPTFLVTLLAMRSRPPDPQIVGESWRRRWFERLDSLEPIVDKVIAHQRFDSYWNASAVNHRVAELGVPAFVVSGIAEPVMSSHDTAIVAGARTPVFGIVGPWGHKRPHDGVPGPAIGYLQEVLRWFDHWLKGQNKDVLRWPKMRLWMPEGIPAKNYYRDNPGRWLAEREWPSPAIESLAYYLAPRALVSDTPEPAQLSHRSVLSVGLRSGEWSPFLAYSPSPELPGDQRDDDAKSLCFDSEPLRERLEIVGRPSLTLDLAADRRNGFICVRLCDVAPDGASSRVTFALLNLTHRDDNIQPKALEPGRRYRITIELEFASYAFRPGHRIRLAISTSYWPTCWPTPDPATITVDCGGSRLSLPVRRPRSDDAAIQFDGVETAPPPQFSSIGPSYRRDRLIEHLDTGLLEITTEETSLTRLEHNQLVYGMTRRQRAALREGDPLSAVQEVDITWRIERDTWKTRTETRFRMAANATDFLVDIGVDAYENEKRVRARDWHFTIPRDLL